MPAAVTLEPPLVTAARSTAAGQRARAPSELTPALREPQELVRRPRADAVAHDKVSARPQQRARGERQRRGRECAQVREARLAAAQRAARGLGGHEHGARLAAPLLAV